MDRAGADSVFKIFESLDPSPKTELSYKNHFTLTIAVLLSAQAKDSEVNKATGPLFENYFDPYSIVGLGEEGLKGYIKTINLKNTKARNIIALSKILIENHGGNIPDSFDELVKLPGIGRKSANVILNCAFGRKTLPVDTHVYRVARRMGFSASENIIKVELDLVELIPPDKLDRAHHWLVLHGRYICKARAPLCPICPVKEYCGYYGASPVKS